jgi:aspartyl-tRNA(Asn)/glutamyl-tRNA(Gln) amidotransferase subunit A
MRPAIEAALETIRAIGLKTVETKLPDFPHGALAGTVIAAEGSSVFEQLITSGKVNELVDARQIEGLKAGLDIPAKDYLKAMRIRSLLKRKFRELFADVDVIIAPGRYGIAPPISEPLDGSGNRGPQPTRPSAPGMTGLIPAGNLAGLPALSLPCGFSRGMPASIQVVGPPFGENTLLAVGREFQNRTEWHKRRPPAPEA